MFLHLHLFATPPLHCGTRFTWSRQIHSLRDARRICSAPSVRVLGNRLEPTRAGANPTLPRQRLSSPAGAQWRDEVEITAPSGRTKPWNDSSLSCKERLRATSGVVSHTLLLLRNVIVRSVHSSRQRRCSSSAVMIVSSISSRIMFHLREKAYAI